MLLTVLIRTVLHCLIAPALSHVCSSFLAKLGGTLCVDTWQAIGVLSDVLKFKLNHYIRDAQNKLVWRELTCIART